MAQVFMFGGEDGSLNAFTNFEGPPTCLTTVPRTGAYSMYVVNAERSAAVMLSASALETYTRLAIYPTGRSYGFNGFLPKLVCFCNNLGTPHVMLGCDGLGILRLVGSNDNTYLASGGVVIPDNAWTVLEIYAKIADSPNGVLQVKVNGVLDLDFSGDTLRASSGGDMTYVKFGRHSWGNYTEAVVTGYYDDIVINDVNGSVNDTWPGQGGVRPLIVDGDGTTTEWTPSAGSNYACVDEVPASNTDYVSDSVIDHVDLYTLDTSQLPAAGTVAAVKWMARAKVDSDAANITPVVRSGGTTEQQADIPLTVSYALKQLIMDVDPIDDAAWTIAKVNALELGIAVG